MGKHSIQPVSGTVPSLLRPQLHHEIGHNCDKRWAKHHLTDRSLWTYHAVSGAFVTTFEMPAGLLAGPITNKLCPARKQYLIVAPGSHSRVGFKVGSKLGDNVIADELVEVTKARWIRVCDAPQSRRRLRPIFDRKRSAKFWSHNDKSVRTLDRMR